MKLLQQTPQARIPQYPTQGKAFPDVQSKHSPSAPVLCQEPQALHSSRNLPDTELSLRHSYVHPIWVPWVSVSPFPLL